MTAVGLDRLVERGVAAHLTSARRLGNRETTSRLPSSRELGPSAAANRARWSSLLARLAGLVARWSPSFALGIGSVHPRRQPSTAARIAYLDSVIKCPSCIDLSIAQSDAAHRGRASGRGRLPGSVTVSATRRSSSSSSPASASRHCSFRPARVPMYCCGPCRSRSSAAARCLLGGYLWRRRRLEVPA